MTIHSSHPFLEHERVAARQLRGRLGARVSLWCAGMVDGDDASDASGLTVSSMLVAAGEPWRVIALLDPDAELTQALLDTRAAVVSLLDWHHRQLSEVFASRAPSPGGPFRASGFEQTEWGPRLLDADTWAGVRLESSRSLGWSSLATCVIEHVVLGEDPDPLHHVRGHYVNGFGR
ncbi:flavin reductase family protein [Aestuariimicrobium ganziense]|uniref:flavin reductase family protein n=1 Tax=Aestuariimicrobium ganziense TaxID=2773677 RepID=UPI0019429520|nr:flavin reductase family protein [Aestuariimicrobium ganziense]